MSFLHSTSSKNDLPVHFPASNRKVDRSFPTAPLRFTPLYKDYLWGGHRLSELFKRPLNPVDTIAESWEIADHPNGKSVVACGPMQGRTLGDILAADPARLLGVSSAASDSIPFAEKKLRRLPHFPVMMKHLDANERLSIQVHPSDATARRMHLDDSGKTEAWVVLDVQPGAALWCGFKKKYSRRTIEEALRCGRLVDLLHRIEPQVGDCFLIEAGTIHSCAGLLLTEVQQNSDTTFRLFDWDRVGPDGRQRPLHIEQACESIDYSRGPVSRQEPRKTDQPGCEQLVRSDYFAIHRRTINESQTRKPDGFCHLVTVLEGSVEILIPLRRQRKHLALFGEESIRLLCGDTLLLPACCDELVWQANSGEAVLLDVTVPKTDLALVA